MAEPKPQDAISNDSKSQENDSGKINGGLETPKKDTASNEFRLGDLVWAKLSSFPAWPGRIVKPWKNVKKPSGKKQTYFVYFFGTEDHAWVRADNLKHYLDHKEAMVKMAKGVKIHKAIEAIEAAIRGETDKKLTISPYHPEDEDDIVPKKSTKDYTREPHSGKSKQINSSQPPDSPRKKRGRPRTIIDEDIKTDGNKDNDDSRPIKIAAKKKTKSYRNDTDSVRVSSYTPKRKSHIGSGGSPVKRPKSDNVTFSSLSLYNSFQAHLAEKSGTISKADIKPTDKSIGFIGLGLMGTGMAMNLIRTGHNVTVWNRTTVKCEEIVKAGAEQAETVADLVKMCDITFSMVSDSEALRAIVYGENGAAAGMTEGKAFVDMSTVDIGTITGVEAAISSRGGRFLEAPVSGSVSPAMEGSLIVLAAGDKDVYEECQSCFRAMGKKAFFLGDVGNGARMKLVLNLIGGNIMCGLAEGMALADKAGLCQNILLEVLNLGSLASPLVCGKGKAIIAGKFPPAFPLKYQQKDFRLALAMADQVEQPLPVSAAAHEVYKRAKNHGLGESDMSAVYRSINK